MTVNPLPSLSSGLPQDLERFAIETSMRDLPPPRSARRVASLLLFLLPLTAILLLFVPWQQSAVGTGRVIAYAPAERMQSIESPISARVATWHVVEGQRVAEGELLAELSDIDVNLPTRLASQAEAAESGLDAAIRGLEAYQAKLDAEIARRDLVLAENDAKIAEQDRKRAGEAAEMETARWNDERVATLASEGLASTRDRELAALALAKSESSLRARDAALRAARASRTAAGRAIDARIASAQADVRAAEGDVAEARSKVESASGSVARMDQRLVYAPRAGMVHSVRGGPGGELVSAGDTLVTLVPETNSRAVEIKLDGNDVTWVHEGDEVRLLFEGWPAVQFVGLPGAGGGTFAGRVAFVDATDDGAGKFRAVVVPDVEQAPWPLPERLRQGVRAKGFVLMGRVSLGYELWRQINGFPPLPPVEKGEKNPITSIKKPRNPTELR